MGAGGLANGILENALLFLGAVAVVLSALIHLHLWMRGYSEITTIGPLFLAQAISGFLIAATVLSFRKVWAALLGSGYLLATITGFLLSVNIGLFGFGDTWSAPFARSAFSIEVVGVFLLSAEAALRCVREFPGRH